ncbi:MULTISPECIES: hypothetical protein [unclassified Paenibacillus]|uniref:hypothetical protein n=1 Tax=unclassified Paenibacillus TaxID=185978 RepID=UPI0009A5D24D|nr:MULTISPECIES: hypothetical protein [unclassified Paenibacillus]SLK16625.1 hypothetical protein SAMN06272722_110209 [Paenibacillus sp. RU5A]SOC74423.1 hypothetical protein SAMN05880581_110209 [Paenibacillus sp. RU26A]SOC76594.1 hypothetical protein SAMN05880586_110209 [Paenibacillus sp. RU5M]
MHHQKLNQFKRTFVIFNVFILLFVVAIQVKAEAASTDFAPGELEAGAIMQWGGTALLAAAGNATGIEPAIMEQVHDFGIQAWQDADSSTKAAITSSIKGLDDLWGTNRKYSLQWDSDAQIYLVKKFDEYFGAGALIKANKIVKVATVKSIILASMVNYGNNIVGDLGFMGTSTGRDMILQSVSVDTMGRVSVSFNVPFTLPPTLANEKFPNALAAYHAVVKELGIKPTFQTVRPTFADLSQSIQYKPLSYTKNFPTRLTIPALKGIVDSRGEITTLEKPNIGRVGSSLTGEIAISYPTYIGDTGTFTSADAVTVAPPEVPVGGGNGNGDGGATDSPTYSPLDLMVYKAMLQFIQDYRVNHSNNLDQLLDYMKLNDSGKPSNKEAWNTWLGSF